MAATKIGRYTADPPAARVMGGEAGVGDRPRAIHVSVNPEISPALAGGVSASIVDPAPAGVAPEPRAHFSHHRLEPARG